MDKLREINNYLAFLKDKQQLPLKKTKFIAFEYDSSANLSLNVLNEAAEKNFIGKVSYSRKRRVYRNLKAAYAPRMEKDISKEYEKILNYFSITQKEGIATKFLQWLKGTFSRYSEKGKLPKPNRI